MNTAIDIAIDIDIARDTYVYTYRYMCVDRFIIRMCSDSYGG